MRGRRFFMVPLAAVLMAAPACAEESRPRGIGMEKDVAVTLDRGDYQPKPLDDRTPLILRLDDVKPQADGHFTYRFHYIAFEPGTYKLAGYLVQPDGSPPPPTEEAAIEVEAIRVDSLLPADFDGKLNAFGPRPFPWFGGYRMMLGGLAVLWLCGLPALIWLGRKKKETAPVEIAPPPLSYAELLRPYVEDAAAGRLTASGQAELERLLTGYWREKLNRPELRMAETVAELKKHPEAGALLLALERWLHQPGGATKEEVDRLLEPYRSSTTANPVLPAQEVASA